MTPADVLPDAFNDWLMRIAGAIEQGERLILLRLPFWTPERVRELASALLPVARARGAQLILSGDVEGALALGDGVGVQLKAQQLADHGERPLPLRQWVGASCHAADELARALLLADFATLSPVATTASHPGTAPMGWPAFASMVEQAALPVYALGGMTEADLATARQLGGQGVAGIRGFW